MLWRFPIFVFLFGSFLSSPQIFANPNVCIEALEKVKADLKKYRKLKENEVEQISLDNFQLMNAVYDSSFRKFIYPHQSFGELLRSRRVQEKSTHVLDIFGSAIFVDRDSGDTLTGMSVTQKKGGKGEKKRRVIAGDPFEESTWENLYSSMKRRQIPAFDLITILPLGAIRSLHDHWIFQRNGEIYDKSHELQPELYAFSHLYFDVLSKAYNILSPNEGRLFFQMPPYGFYRRDWPANWMRSIAKGKIGHRFEVGFGRLTKTRESLKTLPPIEE